MFVARNIATGGGPAGPTSATVFAPFIVGRTGPVVLTRPFCRSVCPLPYHTGIRRPMRLITTLRQLTAWIPNLLEWGAVAVIVLALTWPLRFESHGHWENIVWPPFSRHNSGFDFLQNVLLFLPFGYFSAKTNHQGRWRTVLWISLAGACLSFAGEFCQVFIHFRSPSSTDIVMNTAGACAGSIVAVVLGQLRIACGFE
jgi:hypothetical protein